MKDIRDKMEIKEEQHLFTSDQKLKWFGYGEWIEEADRLKFKYFGYECMIHRICEREPYYAKEEMYFGGYLCGYVRVPEYHPYFCKEYWNMGIECHGGLTYGKKDAEFWIGFDCAHSCDLIPSIDFFKKQMKASGEFEPFPIPKEFEHMALFNPTYKNMQYCLDECVHIIDQLKNIAFTDMTKSASEQCKEDLI